VLHHPIDLDDTIYVCMMIVYACLTTTYDLDR